jgi:hypothetical protein
LNYRQANSLTAALGIRSAIRREANQRGIEDKDIGRFVGDMEKGIVGAIPEFANILQEQQMEGQIPNPREMTKEVRNDIIV